MSLDIVQHGSQILDVKQKQTSFVSYPEHDVQYPLLSVVKAKDTAQKLRSHL